MAIRKKGRLDKRKRVRAIARERVGAVKPSRVLETPQRRKKPKHKKPLTEETGDNGLD